MTCSQIRSSAENRSPHHCGTIWEPIPGLSCYIGVLSLIMLNAEPDRLPLKQLIHKVRSHIASTFAVGIYYFLSVPSLFAASRNVGLTPLRWGEVFSQSPAH